MASETKIGRNDRCPCGSGRKYKNCCQGKAGRLGPMGWAGLLAIVAVVAFVAVSILSAGRGGSDTGSDTGPGTTCPPGQVWSPGHGHCHDV